MFFKLARCGYTLRVTSQENINVLSQSSDLDKEALDQIEKKTQAKNTYNKSILYFIYFNALLTVFPYC
jgi:hypothetical protein